MKIGLFDSGLGGLVISHSLIRHLPQYDYIYLGDTARLPYGNRSRETVTRFTVEGVRYLLDRGSVLVIVACNTASSDALRIVQQELVPKEYPGRNVLGVLIPASEAAVAATQSGRIGVLATTGTVQSGAFIREIAKLMPSSRIFQQAAPLLVPLLEHDGQQWISEVVEQYLSPLLQEEIDTLILGCTHYPLVKEDARRICGPGVQVISQDEIVPRKLEEYLFNHPEIATKLTQKREKQFFLTDIHPQTEVLAKKLFKTELKLEKATIEKSPTT